ncbi:MAG: L,D-transpeptidase family protein [Bacteriovorax sp.]|nr:L,D-transpeptidase family protein [Bacteriovorax sp.]
MKTLIPFILSSFLITSFSQVFALDSIREIRVFKSDRRLELVDGDNQILKTYKIMLGRSPEGAKKEEGDNKTPEGSYVLDLKSNDSKFHKSFHINYPNTRDIIKAKFHGKKPGGDIMLHGYPDDFSEMRDWLKFVQLDNNNDDFIRAGLGNFDWTNGCIAVTDEEIDEIFSIVDVPMKIIINP